MEKDDQADLSAREDDGLTPQERFAYNLRRRRVAVGISQEELGERTELHRTEISLLERAGREPRFATLLKLCGALATTPDELCEGTGWDHERRRFTAEAPAGD
jgi:transcriptional regulator with XRE-family HTH domain